MLAGMKFPLLGHQTLMGTLYMLYMSDIIHYAHDEVLYIFLSQRTDPYDPSDNKCISSSAPNSQMEVGTHGATYIIGFI